MTRQRKPPFDGDSARRAVIAVGDGRGFVMEIAERNPIKEGIWLMGKIRRPRRWIKKRFVVTASHCLPHLPPAHPNAFKHERTYALLGPLGKSSPSIMAECLFADPVADIAVMGEPDGQIFNMLDDAFLELIEAAEVLRVGAIVKSMRGWLLSLDGHWNPCTVESRPSGGHGLWISGAAEGIIGGMSGSPILADNGRAIGMVCTSVGTGPNPHTDGGPNPRLTHCLPGWLLERIRTLKS